MNYDSISLHASEPDADESDDQGGNGQDDSQDQANDSDGQADDAQDDQADDNDDDSSGDEDVDADVDQPQARGIQGRAAKVRAQPEFNAAEFAANTAAQTAQHMAQATRQANEQAERDRSEREAMSAMTDEQRATYLLAKETNNLKQGQAHTQLLIQSSTDQSKFGRMLNGKPQFAKYEDEVERRHQSILARGGFTDRQTILAHLIGERALKSENVQKQKTQARARVQAQRSAPARGARGDAGDGTPRNSNQRSSLISKMERDNPII